MISNPVLHTLLLWACVSCLCSPEVQASNATLDIEHFNSFNGFVESVDDNQVHRYIKEFLLHPEDTEEVLGRTILYFPVIEKELAELNLPSELKVLPFIESRYDPCAISSVGAAGLWQLMPATARGLGVKISRYIDERRDPHIATKAALNYLAYLYGKYEDWSLALAAYNAGPGNVNRAIRAANGNKSFEAIKQFLPRETQKYIPKYLAAQYVLEHFKDYGLNPSYPELDLQLTGNVHVKKHMNIKQISQATGIDETNILSLNPSLRRHFVPTLSQGFQLVLPLRVIEKFNHFLMDLEIPPLVFEYRSLEVEVTSELSIFEIGQSLNVDPYLLKHWNHLSGDYVRKGQKLLVHELFDPNIKELRKNPNPRVEPLLQLPKTSTLQDHFSNLLQVYRRRELERQNWDVHHLLVSL